jgi:hypothetical protein
LRGDISAMSPTKKPQDSKNHAAFVGYILAARTQSTTT